MIQNLKTIFQLSTSRAIAVFAFISMSILLAISSQTITIIQGALFVELTVQKLLIIFVVSLLFSVALPLNIAAFHKARVATTGTNVLASISAIASLSCCSPALFGLLALVGVSGTSLLGLTIFFKKYWLWFVVTSAFLLMVSIRASINTLRATVCKINRSH